ncbi:MAG: nucleotidyltransferase family protein [Rickettsiales bacterium]
MTTAIILAGGKGTRLQEVVSDLPKPMANISGKPFLEYILRHLHQNNISHVIISVGYKKEIIKEYFGNKYKSIYIEYAEEEKPLGTGGAILNACKKIYDLNNPFYIFNGDSFLNADLTLAMDFHINCKSNLTVLSNYMNDASRYGLINFNQSNEITEFIEKKLGAKGYINSGVYITSLSFISKALRNKARQFSFEEFLATKVKQIKAFTFKTNTYFIDIGIPEDFFQSQKELNKLFD